MGVAALSLGWIDERYLSRTSGMVGCAGGCAKQGPRAFREGVCFARGRALDFSGDAGNWNAGAVGGVFTPRWRVPAALPEKPWHSLRAPSVAAMPTQLRLRIHRHSRGIWRAARWSSGARWRASRGRWCLESLRIVDGLTVRRTRCFIQEWAMGDSNPRPHGCDPCALAS